MTICKCPMCGQGLSQNSLYQMALDDLDPESPTGEKIFEIANWWMYGGDEVGQRMPNSDCVLRKVY